MYDLCFLICGEELLDKIYKGDKFMEEIINNAKAIAGQYMNPLFIPEEEIIKANEEFFREQGIKEKQHDMIINMYKDHLPIETIAKYANLSILEVKKIIDEKE